MPGTLVGLFAISLPMIEFRDIDYSDRDLVLRHTLHSSTRNCDFNFMNLVSWSFIYGTQIAVHRGLLVVRFRFEGRTAYLPPLCAETYCHDEHSENYAAVLLDLFEDTEAQGHPFRMMGVTAEMLERLHAVLPGRFEAYADPALADYIYDRESLSTLAGKKLQPKRNHANRFERTYPDFEFRPLTPEWIDECWRLESTWAAAHTEVHARLDPDAEQHSMRRVFKHWDTLQPLGGILLVEGRLVAFTFGGPINHDTFDVCVEKADLNYDGAYAVINREFVRSLPPQYTLINREEDLGLEGLRRAKQSYNPRILLDKYTVTHVLHS